MKQILICLVAIFLVVCQINTKTIPEKKMRYDNYKLVQVKLDSTKDLELLNVVFKQNPLDVWTNEGVLVLAPHSNTILMSPQQYATYTHFLSTTGKKENSAVILNKNIQTAIDEEQAEMDSYTKEKKTDFFTSYHRYGTIVEFVKNLIKEHPTMVKEIKDFGKTVDGREVIGAIVSSPDSTNKNKKNIFISSLQHSREWIAYNIPLYTMKQLVEDYKKGNSKVRNILDTVNVHIVPLINPDGYEYCHTHRRLWRKNRRNNGNGVYGVDINRNWSYKWGGPGASRDPRADTYMGPSPASEPETQNVVRYAREVLRGKQTCIGALDFHSYSELLLRPWQWSSAVSPHERQLSSPYGSEMQQKIKDVSGITYANIRGSQLYVHSGALVDFWYGDIGVPSFTVELRPSRSSRYGFVLPPSYIKAVVAENYPAVLSFIENCIRNPLQSVSSFSIE